MMSEFKFCPMCGVERKGSEQFCHNCDFEYLTGRYVKSEDGAQNLSYSIDDDQNLAYSGDGAQDIIKSEVNNSEKKIDVQLVSQEEFAAANDLIKSLSAEINESIDKCLNKLAFDLENDIDLKNSNSDFDKSIFSSENLNIPTINGDVEFSDLIEVYNQSHLPGFIINKYKEPVIANINRLNLIIESLGSIENYEGLDRFLDILKDYLNNQESFLNSF